MAKKLRKLRWKPRIRINWSIRDRNKRKVWVQSRQKASKEVNWTVETAIYVQLRRRDVLRCEDLRHFLWIEVCIEEALNAQ